MDSPYSHPTMFQLDDNLYKKVNLVLLSPQPYGFEQSHQVGVHDSYSRYSQYNSFHDKHRIVTAYSDPLSRGLMENYVGVSLLGSMPLRCDNKNISTQTHLHGLRVHHDIANIHLGFHEKPSQCGNQIILWTNVFRQVGRNLHDQNYSNDLLHRGIPCSRLRIAPGDQP